jgi:glycosyltransferase involved in cell wall biosynthesis
LIDAHRNRLWKWVTRFTLRRSAALLGDCDTIRQLAIGHGMPPDRIVTFPWGANIEKYIPLPGPKHLSALRQRLGWGVDTYVLLSTRNWTPLYGVEDLARAFVKARQVVPELRLLMLGNGPLAPMIRRIFQQAGLMEQVHFPGQVSQERLPEYYQSADLYISTSHSDGTSISLLEALACGTPVLLSDIPGNQEWVTEPGRVGWLFADGNVADLTAGILRAHAARAQASALGQAARQLAETRADWKQNFPKLFEAYQIAVGGQQHA